MSREPRPGRTAVGRREATKPSLWFHRLFLSAAIPDEAFMGSKSPPAVPELQMPGVETGPQSLLLPRTARLHFLTGES